MTSAFDSTSDVGAAEPGDLLDPRPAARVRQGRHDGRTTLPANGYWNPRNSLRNDCCEPLDALCSRGVQNLADDLRATTRRRQPCLVCTVLIAVMRRRWVPPAAGVVRVMHRWQSASGATCLVRQVGSPEHDAEDHGADRGDPGCPVAWPVTLPADGEGRGEHRRRTQVVSSRGPG